MKKSKGTLAAEKAWKTMKEQEATMTPKQLKELHLKRSNASKRAWKTMRADKVHNYLGKPAAGFVKIAEKLAKDNGGVLPRMDLMAKFETFSVFRGFGGGCVAHGMSLVARFLATDPRNAAETAAKKMKIKLDPKQQTLSSFRTDTLKEPVSLSYFFEENDGEEIIVVLEGSFSENEADDIVEKDFARYTAKREAALKAWKTSRKNKAA